MTLDEIVKAAAKLQDQNVAPLIVALAENQRAMQSDIAALQSESAFIHRLMRCVSFSLPEGYTTWLSDDDLAQFNADTATLSEALAVNDDPAAAVNVISATQTILTPTPAPLVN